MTVMNYTEVDRRHEPMFLGAPLGLQRYDQMKYPVFYRLAKNMRGFFWTAEEISLSKDRAEYLALSETERFIFDANLRWQTATDSLLNRSITKLQEFVSLPELEAAMAVWGFFETGIHSWSYHYLLQNVYADETVFWDSILSDAAIRGRIDGIKASYDALFNDDDTSIKQRIFNAVVNTNAVEGVSFYVSFACSFWFGAHNKMTGSPKIIGLIERDEALHVAVTTNILKNMRDNPEEGFQEIYQENIERIRECFRLTAEIEKEWAKVLFSKGGLVGLNEAILVRYIEYVTNQRLKMLELEPIYPAQRRNPLGWYKQYVDSMNRQVAPQESELESYTVNMLKKGIRNTELVELLASYDD